MSLLVLAAATGFACMNPAHSSGEVVRCAARGQAMQLHDIVAPEPAVPCGGLFGDCPVDPGAAARDHLAALTRGKELRCTPTGGRTSLDNPPRTIVRCMIGDVDLSCQMVADGYALGNDNITRCANEIRSRRVAAAPPPRPALIIPSVIWRWLPLYLLLMNIVTYFVFAADKRRQVTNINRIAEAELLGLIAFGGGIGALVAQVRLDHMRDEQPFASQAAILLGLQIGAAIAVGAMLTLRI
ncbi:DUF1294 domain-containing protein [Sandarakinorhabdus sp. DWP1-3-1]|uniref:DUF1294 domain-containing protein n=1 Tax=Sandarakinorhabdus sp. DWP1-3-1 TaxID=2804627 RepID=UPI003CE88D9A